MTVVQQGIVGQDSVWSFYPSLTVNASGHTLIAFNTTAATTFPSIAVVGRLVSSPLGTMRPPAVVKMSLGSVDRLLNGRQRFADYSGMALDPSDSASWIHAEYGTSGDFETWVARVELSATFTDSPLVPGMPTRAVHILELRTRINERRVGCGLVGFSFSGVVAPGIPVAAEHLSELRAALDAAYVACGQLAPVYADPVIVSGTTVIRALHILELRAAVVALE